VLNWLARRDYSQHEIAQKLKAKAYSQEAISLIITKLMQANLINEYRFTENYIRSRLAKGYGPLRISKELQVRGILPDQIAEQLQITDNAWLINVRKVWQKHFKGKLPNDFKDRAKQIRFLLYRGFTEEQIESVLKNDEPA